MLPPATGAFFTFEVRKDGYLYFFHKASSHKSYTVFEEGAAIGYTFAMNTANDVLGEVFSFELKGEGEFNNIPEGTAIQWPEKYSPNYANEQIGVSGMGVIKFPVYKDCKYNVNAVGSKIQCAAFGFDTDGATPVYIKGEKTLYLLNTPAALNTVNMNANVVSSQYFLLSGAQVAAPSADAKGLYIVKNFMSDGSVRVEKMVIR